MHTDPSEVAAIDTAPESLGTAFPKEQARIRELITIYRELPNNAGAFGAMMLEDTLRRADEAAIGGDVLAMLRSFAEMQECE